MLHLQEAATPKKVSKTLWYWFSYWLLIKVKCVTGLVEKTYDVEFDKSNGSQGAHENLDDVGDEALREAMKNISVGDIKPKDDEDDVQVIDPPFSSNVPQDDDKDGRVENKDTHISHDQMVAQA